MACNAVGYYPINSSQPFFCMPAYDPPPVSYPVDEEESSNEEGSFTVSIDIDPEFVLPLPEDDDGSEHEGGGEGDDEVEQERQRLLDRLHAGLLHLVANMVVILVLLRWFLHLRQEL